METALETTIETSTETTAEATTETTAETTTETSTETTAETTTERSTETTAETTTETSTETTAETMTETTTEATTETIPETTTQRTTTTEQTAVPTSSSTPSTLATSSSSSTTETATETTAETDESSGDETTETARETTTETTTEATTITTTPAEQTTVSTSSPPPSTVATTPLTAETTTTPPYDPCNPSPCRNGATCVDNGDTFSCICTPGYTGQHCDVEINECEANPCYPFGKCTDLIDDYNCTCNPGYKALPNNTKMCNEINFCANVTDPCENGGTCVNQNALNRYYCICPVYDDKQYVGLRCETEMITKPIVNGGISPTSGIIAGGANVTIRGQGLDLFEPLGAYLIDTTSSPLPSLYAYVIPNLTLSDSIAVRVPPANNTYVDKNLLMIVEYSGPINVTTETDNLRFKYTANPVIQTIEPSEIFVTGGVRLTVSGSNMDTVQNPMMDITTYVFNTTGNRETNESRQSCALKNSSAITCLVPYGIVPASFINSVEPAGKSLRGVFHLDSSFSQKKGRRTKRAPVANLTDDAGSTFEMYLGFIFDEFTTYHNISKSLPNEAVGLVQNQVYIDPTCSMDFDPNKMETISLYGTGLDQGCSEDDYTVLISNVSCNVTDLTSNELQCRPPKDEPPMSHPSASCDSDSHPVMAYVGGTTHHGCCVRYTTDNTDLIIIVTVTCVVVVIIIILVVVILCKRCRRDRENDLTTLTYIERRFFKKSDTLRSAKRENIYVNYDAPQELVEEALNRAAKNNDRRPADVGLRQPKVETLKRQTPTTVVGDSAYLVPHNEAAASTHNRSNVDVYDGRQTTDGVDTAPSRTYSTDDDYLKPSGDTHDETDDISSGRKHDVIVPADDVYDIFNDESGAGSVSEEDPDYLILNDTVVDPVDFKNYTLV